MHQISNDTEKILWSNWLLSLVLLCYWVIQDQIFARLKTRLILILLHYSRDPVKNFKVKKRVYKRVIYYFPSRWKKLLNILFSIKTENIIFNSCFIEIFVSPCVYKLLVYAYIYIYIFSCIEAALQKKRSVHHWIRTIGCL